jgi:predicted transcriptional regulator
MATAQVDLTEQVSQELQAIARRTGKTPEELIREAIDDLIMQFQQEERRSRLRQARGMWKDRQDLPSPEQLRGELDRI